MPIQFILIILIILIILRLIFKLKSHEINIPIFSGWLIIWLIALIFIWRPQVTSYLAIKLGVSRGVDLVIYVAMVAIFYIVFRMLIRTEKIEKDITRLVRQLALRSPRCSSGEAGDDEKNSKGEKDV